MTDFAALNDDQRSLAESLQQRGATATLSKSGWLLRVDFRANAANASDEVVHALARSLRLKELSLAGAPVTTACIDDLLTLENLNVLDVENTILDDSAIERLAGLRNLSMLIVRGTRVTNDCVRALRRRLTRVRIVS